MPVKVLQNNKSSDLRANRRRKNNSAYPLREGIVALSKLLCDLEKTVQEFVGLSCSEATVSCLKELRLKR